MPSDCSQTDAPAAPRFELQQLVNASGIGRGQLVRVVSANGPAWRLALDEGLSFDQADRWAVKCGLLPYDVWPEWLDESIERCSRECEAPDCAVRFVQPVVGRRQKPQRFCSRRCMKRTSARRRYADPVARAHRLSRHRGLRRDAREAAARRAAKREQARPGQDPGEIAGMGYKNDVDKNDYKGAKKAGIPAADSPIFDEKPVENPPGPSHRNGTMAA